MSTTDMKRLRATVTFAENTPKPECLTAYRFVSDIGWIPVAESPSALEFPATELHLISWNIDAQGDLLEERFLGAMQHLRKKVFENSVPPPPCCILLQEVHEDVLPILLRHRWIREHFLVTPISTDTWTIPYGIVTLVSKAVPVSTVFVIELPKTAVGRQALFVDVHLSGPPIESPGGNKNKTDSRVRAIRICNTHLEPEPSGARARPAQLEHIARMLNVSNLDAYICAGSMISVWEADKTAPSKAGFADAYKGAKGSGMTWGFQPRTQIPSGRLDKVLYFPTEKVEIGCPTQIGYRTTIKGGSYVSDHCGLLTMVKVLRDS